MRPDLAQLSPGEANLARPNLYIWSGLGAHFGVATGVGRHAKNMGRHLLDDRSWRSMLVLAHDQAEPGRANASGSPPVIRLPLRRAHADIVWTLCGRPCAARWLEGPGWIYCPKEKYVPAGDLRYAVTVHDIYAFEPGSIRRGPADFLRRRRFERMLREANLVFVVSNFTKGRLLDRFALDEAKIVVVGNGVEDEYFAVNDVDPEACRGDLGRAYVLLVGGLRRKKGAADILRLADALATADPSMAVVVVGPVEPEFAGATGSRRNLRVISRGIPDSEMARLVRGASVALSLSAYEGFGIPLLEAMAAGVPVVAAARSAFPEVVGDAGILVDPDKPKEIAGIVCDLARDGQLRGACVARGRRRAEEFRWSACAARVSRAMLAYDRGEPLC